MATLIIHDGSLARSGRRRRRCRAVVRSACHLQASAQPFDPACGCWPGHQCRRPVRPPAEMPRPLSSTSRCKLAMLHAQAQPDLGGAGMANDVVQRFLHRQKELMPGLGGQRVLGQIGRHVQPAANRGRAERTPPQTAKRNWRNDRANRCAGFTAQTMASIARTASRAVVEMLCRGPPPPPPVVAMFLRPARSAARCG